MANETNIFEQHESEIRAYCRAVPTVFKSAKNAVMIDENNDDYIDFFAGAGVLNFGHNNTQMQDAIIEFIKNDGVIQSLDMFTDVKRDFIKSFVKTILEPRKMGDYKLQFTGPTGTNAVEAALKLARKVTGRTEVVAFHRGFHGMTLGALACTANNAFRSSSGVPLNNVIRGTFNDMHALKLMREQIEHTGSGLTAPAAFIIEPLQAEGGVHEASYEWIQAVQKLAKDTGALLILDDIQGASGRTGSYFSFDDMDLDPDIIVLAKGLGGIGTPIGMCINKPEYDKAGGPGQHTGTFRGQGLSYVAGRVGIEFFKDETFNSETKRKGEIIRAVLDQLNEKYSQVIDVRQKGMMLAINFDSPATAKAITTKCFENRLIIAACSTGEIVKFIPPLTIEDEILQEGLKRFTDAVTSTLG